MSDDQFTKQEFDFTRDIEKSEMFFLDLSKLYIFTKPPEITADLLDSQPLVVDYKGMAFQKNETTVSIYNYENICF